MAHRTTSCILLMLMMLISASGCLVSGYPVTELPTFEPLASRLDPEEAGYCKRCIDPLRWCVNSAARFAAVSNFVADATSRPANTIQIDSAMSLLKMKATNHLAELNGIEPPQAFRELHLSVVAVLSEAAGISNGPDSDLASFRSRCIASISEASRLTKILQFRQRRLMPSPLKIEFQPSGVPIAIDLMNGNVRAVAQLDLPVGSLTVEPREIEGVTTIVVKSHGRIRLFAIDGRRFELNVDASNLILDGSTLTLDADAIASAKRLQTDHEIPIGTEPQIADVPERIAADQMLPDVRAYEGQQQNPPIEIPAVTSSNRSYTWERRPLIECPSGNARHNGKNARKYGTTWKLVAAN